MSVKSLPLRANKVKESTRSQTSALGQQQASESEATSGTFSETLKILPPRTMLPHTVDPACVWSSFRFHSPLGNPLHPGRSVQRVQGSPGPTRRPDVAGYWAGGTGRTGLWEYQSLGTEHSGGRTGQRNRLQKGTGLSGLKDTRQ